MKIFIKIFMLSAFFLSYTGLFAMDTAKSVGRVRQLLNAIHRNDVEAVRGLIHAGVNVNTEIEHFGLKGYSPLHMAAGSNETDLEIVEMLLYKGANIDAVREGGETPLLLAADSSASAIASRLIRAGADINAANEWGRTALHSAAAQKNPEMVRMLIDAKANLNAKIKSNGETPLMWAMRSGNQKVVRMLIDAMLETGSTKASIAEQINKLPLSPMHKPSLDYLEKE